MKNNEPCTLNMPGAEWLSLIRIYHRGQKLIEELASENLIRSTTAESIRQFKEAYMAYHRARQRVEMDYMQRDSLGRRIAKRDVLASRMERGVIQGEGGER